MRRTGHIRERSPGAFELRYSLGTDPATGKRKIATATVRGSRKDAERELRRLLHALDTGQHVDPHRMTVREWLTIWVGSMREGVAPKTHERYGEIVNHFLIPALGNLQLVKLAAAHIQAAHNLWAVGGRRDGKEGGLSPQTRRHLHGVLGAALRRAVKQQLIIRNPCAAFDKNDLPKVETRKMETLSTEQSLRLLDAVRHSHIYWPVLIALATGARRGEILALRWRNFDLDNGTMRIVASLEQTKTGLRFKSTKTVASRRTVTLPSFAVEELRRRKHEQATSLLALGVRQTGETLVCARQDGAPLQPQSLTHEFPRFLARLGTDFPRIRFHDLRHSHATQLLSEGVHPKVAQERLGHSTVTTTLDLYSHVAETMQKDAADRIDAAFEGAKMRSRDGR
jgi:integrase